MLVLAAVAFAAPASDTPASSALPRMGAKGKEDIPHGRLIMGKGGGKGGGRLGTGGPD